MSNANEKTIVTKANAIDSRKVVKNNWLWSKVKDIADKIPKQPKFITTSDFNELTKLNFDDRLRL